MKIQEIINLYKDCLDPVTQRLQNPSPALNIKMLVIYEEIRALQKNPASANYQELQRAVQNGEVNDRAIIDWIEYNEPVLAQAHKNLRALKEYAFTETQTPPDQRILLRANGTLSTGQIPAKTAQTIRPLNLHQSVAAGRVTLEIDEKATAQLIEESIGAILAKFTEEITTARDKALGSSFIVDDATKNLTLLLNGIDPAHQPHIKAAIEAAIKAHPSVRVVGAALIAAGLAAAKASTDGLSAVEINAAGQSAATISASGGNPGQAKFAGETIAIIANAIATTYTGHPDKANIINIAIQAASKALQDHMIENHNNLSNGQLKEIASHAGKIAAKIAANVVPKEQVEKSALAGGAAAAIESMEAASTDESILAAGMATAIAFNAGGDQAKHASAAGVAAGTAFRKALADGHSLQAAQKAAENAGVAVSNGRNTAVEESTAAAKAYDTHHSDIATLAATMVAVDYPAEPALQIEAAAVAANAEQAGRHQTAHLEGVVAAIIGKKYPGNNDAKTAAIDASIEAANAGRQSTIMKEAITAAQMVVTYPNNPAAITAAVMAAVTYEKEPEQTAASMAAAEAVVLYPAHANDLGSIAAAQRIALGSLAKSAKENLAAAKEVEKPLQQKVDYYREEILKQEQLITAAMQKIASFCDATGQPIPGQKNNINFTEGQLLKLRKDLDKLTKSFNPVSRELRCKKSNLI